MIRKLGVNIDHVATVRQARQSPYPDPVAAAMVAELAGADQITCHIRGDRRHIQDADLPRLAAAVQTCLNVELAATEEMLSLITEVLPAGHRVTLVPEREGEVTTEGGLNVVALRGELEQAVVRLREARLGVSLFVDPEVDQVKAAVDCGIDMIELNTARYADDGPDDLPRIVEATNTGLDLGVEVAAGHGLTHHNLAELVAAAPEISEYNIGHSIVARSIFVGLDRAVRDLKEIIA